MDNRDQITGSAPSRRDFLKTSTAATVGAAMAANLTLLSTAHAAGSDVLKIGLVGCGGRGTGAAKDSLTASEGVKLVAMGDVFRDRLDASRKQIREQFGDRADVKEDHCFVGLNAIDRVLASDVDLVILATPPGFRPFHIEKAVAAGKHIFAEKPVGVDGPGIRRVLAAAEEAKKKNLAVGTGTQRRHEAGYVEAMKRIHDGALGKLVAARCYWNQGPLWVKPRQSNWSDVEWQIRNWLYFTWLSGDHICEQHVHNLDVINWAMQAHPIRAYGMGGRQVRVGPEYGNIYDHFAIEYEYPNGAFLASQCRQIAGCDNSVAEALSGTKGSAQTRPGNYVIQGENRWRHRGKDERNPYVQEHVDLIASIKEGKPHNELKATAESTLTAIMGRMSAYTGKAVSWEQALNSTLETMPPNLDLTVSLPVPPVAVPGQTPLV